MTLFGLTVPMTLIWVIAAIVVVLVIAFPVQSSTDKTHHPT